MSSKEAIAKSLDKIEREINRTSNFIHIDTDTKPMPLINMAIDKLHTLKEMEFNIKQFS
jgi:hypothetical protein